MKKKENKDGILKNGRNNRKRKKKNNNNKKKDFGRKRRSAGKLPSLVSSNSKRDTNKNKTQEG